MSHALHRVRQQVAAAASRAGRSTDDIRLIAVSKTRSLAEVQQLHAAGQKDFGENQLQDALSKIPALGYPQAEWHLIGHLQTNKVKHVAGHFQWLHTLDSLKLADKLHAAMVRAGESEPLNCLLQVNYTAQAGRSGVAPGDVEDLLADCLKSDYPLLKFRGLMTIGVRANAEKTRAVFASLRESRDQCRVRFGLDDFDQLSMGMSDDFEIAIDEGSTMLRIGTRIFGERDYSK